MADEQGKPADQEESNRRNADTRYQLARVVIVGGFLTIFLLIGALLGLSRSGADAETTKVADKIFNVILPVLASWVGTVLAFFFSAQSQERMSNTLDKQIDRAATGGAAGSDKLTTQVMIPFVSIRGVVDLETTDPATLTVGEMVKRFRGEVPAPIPPATPPAVPPAEPPAEGAPPVQPPPQEPVVPAREPLSRLVFVKGKTFRYVMHESVLNAFWRRVSEQDPAAKPADKTLNDMLAQPDIQALISRQVAFVGGAATVAEAKAAMERVAGAEDVVVTATGVSAEPMLGWLTDRDLLKAINGV